MQATFGPTNRSITEYQKNRGVSDNVSQNILFADRWIADQMSLPVNLLRTHARRRSNPRVLHDSTAGRFRRPCESGSRWHRYAFTQRDKGKQLNISRVMTRNSNISAYVLRIDDQIRAEIDKPERLFRRGSDTEILKRSGTMTYLICVKVTENICA